MSTPHIVWFRQDLRVSDQAALAAAAAAGPVIPVYILDDAAPEHWRMGAASRWWLHHSLASLSKALEKYGGTLLLLKGDAVATLKNLMAATGATTVHALEHFEPWAQRQQAALGGALTLHQGLSLAHPTAMRTGSGTSFKVFTPFWRALQMHMPPSLPKPPPKKLHMFPDVPAGDSLYRWKLLPENPDWATPIKEHWSPGSAGAHAQLNAFVDHAENYSDARNTPSVKGTSKLSPHLHFGEISPAEVWHGVPSVEPYLRQLGWRDFSCNLLLASPDFADVNWKSNFDSFPWVDDKAGLKAWQYGTTGYPIVDAGMRELYATGWMHNRIRMITASFLIKDLMIDWRAGEAWFWDTLVDASLGNNAAGWQWVAGSGADASPYYRIFNPVSQGEKFDANGIYVRRWVPELAKLPNAHIHAPWLAPKNVLDYAGVELGKTYPKPIVNHDTARLRALAAYKSLKAA